MNLKKEKNGTAKFKQLDAAQMDKIKSGLLVEITNPDGTTTVWI